MSYDEVRHQQRLEYINLFSGEATLLELKNDLRFKSKICKNLEAQRKLGILIKKVCSLKN